LAEEPIIRLILDGTVARVRLDKKVTSILLHVAPGVRADGQKVLLAVENMGGVKQPVAASSTTSSNAGCNAGTRDCGWRAGA
jgi:hypothetical protein